MEAREGFTSHNLLVIMLLCIIYKDYPQKLQFTNVRSTLRYIVMSGYSKYQPLI